MSAAILNASGFTVGSLVLAGLLALGGCRDKKPENLAPVASSLSAAKPAGEKALTFQVDTPSSKVSFMMEAPIEKISGDAPGSLDGELFVDPADLSKSTGLVKVDLGKLTLFQEKREDDKAAFGERAKSDKQNEHAQNWLEIGSDAPDAQRKLNRLAEFSVTKLEGASVNDLGTLSGAERKVTAVVVGELRLHGRKNEKRSKVELTFKYDGDKPQAVSVRTLEPLPIGLEEYDVRPRDAFGKLAQKTLDSLGSKVAKTAPIQLEFSAKAK
jgi:hypothetical protein